jgi:hypothetical protein
MHKKTVQLSMPEYAPISTALRDARAGQYHLGIANFPATVAENLASFTASSGRQCRSNPVSSGSLQKMGIIQ